MPSDRAAVEHTPGATIGDKPELPPPHGAAGPAWDRPEPAEEHDKAWPVVGDKADMTPPQGGRRLAAGQAAPTRPSVTAPGGSAARTAPERPRSVHR